MKREKSTKRSWKTEKSKKKQMKKETSKKNKKENDLLDRLHSDFVQKRQWRLKNKKRRRKNREQQKKNENRRKKGPTFNFSRNKTKIEKISFSEKENSVNFLFVCLFWLEGRWTDFGCASSTPSSTHQWISSATGARRENLHQNYNNLVFF